MHGLERLWIKVTLFLKSYDRGLVFFRKNCSCHWCRQPVSLLPTPLRLRFVREEAKLVLTYQSERQKGMVEDLGAELKANKILACRRDEKCELDNLVTELSKDGMTNGYLRPAASPSQTRKPESPVC